MEIIYLSTYKKKKKNISCKSQKVQWLYANLKTDISKILKCFNNFNVYIFILILTLKIGILNEKILKIEISECLTITVAEHGLQFFNKVLICWWKKYIII